MNSNQNMFYLDNSTKSNRIQYSEYKNNSQYTPALTQGNNFNNYQNKIKNNLKNKINNVNRKEGFQNSSDDSSSSFKIGEQSNQVLNDTSSGKNNSLQIRKQ